MSGKDDDDNTLPHYPADYVVPEKWSPPQTTAGGTFGSINQPTAGARREAKLPRGVHPIQLYSLGTPNGHKVTILLEELGVEYDAWKIDIMKGDQFGSDFVEINPNSKIPAMVDYTQSPPLRVFESGSILLYLAEREKKFLPQDLPGRTECINWLMWQMGSAPYIGGGFGHFYKYAPNRIKYAIDRFSMETKRQLDVLDQRLDGRAYVCGDAYTIADMAIFPWIRCLEAYYGGKTFLSMDEYKHVQRWMKTIHAREAVQRGLRVNGFEDDAVKERHSKDDFNVKLTDEPDPKKPKLSNEKE